MGSYLKYSGLHNTCHHSHCRVLADKAYGSSKAKELLLTLSVDVEAIDIPHQVTLTALHSAINDIEDALQYYTAIHHRLDYFISSGKSLQKAAKPTYQFTFLKNL